MTPEFFVPFDVLKGGPGSWEFPLVVTGHLTQVSGASAPNASPMNGGFGVVPAQEAQPGGGGLPAIDPVEAQSFERKPKGKENPADAATPSAPAA